MSVVEVTFEGFGECQKAMNNLAEMIERPGQKLMARLGEAVMDDVDNRFMTRGYGTWAALRPATLRRKKSGMILIETGEMFAGTRIAYTTDTYVNVYATRPSKPMVPFWHQEGTKYMVARPIMDATPTLTESLVEVVNKWITDMLAAFRTEV